jgi:hypothetical protein
MDPLKSSRQLTKRFALTFNKKEQCFGHLEAKSGLSDLSNVSLHFQEHNQIFWLKEPLFLYLKYKAKTGFKEAHLKSQHSTD